MKLLLIIKSNRLFIGFSDFKKAALAAAANPLCVGALHQMLPYSSTLMPLINADLQDFEIFEDGTGQEKPDQILVVVLAD